MNDLPSADVLFPNEYKTSCFIKNAVKSPNIIIGDYTIMTTMIILKSLKKRTCFSTILNLATG